MTGSVDIKQINRIAQQAGKKIMEIYHDEDFSKVVDFKADDSPLTMADKEAHKVIAAELAALTPEIPVLSEEGKAISYEERRQWDTFWLVDPLDGTKEFIKRNGEFTVNIALIDGHRPVLGVIYVPATGTWYYGAQGAGAYKKTGDGAPVALKTASKKADRIAVKSRSHASDEEQEVLNQYGVTDFISVGSSLKFCMVAEGKADIYYRHGPTMEWDTGAGQAVLEAAGGAVVDENGPFSYNKPSLLNGSFICFADPAYAQEGKLVSNR